jgi:hypothetical protein
VKPFSYQDFDFCHWDFNFRDGWIGDAWVAKKVIAAPNVKEAINTFRDELIPIIDRIAFVSQCFTIVEAEPFIVIKQNNNTEKILFLRYTRGAAGTPLMFDDDEIESLKQLEPFQDKEHVFRFLRESTYGMTLHTRLPMLISALEGMAGEIVHKRGNKTNMDFIRNEILNDEKLYNRIFQYDQGIRQQLLHGKKLDVVRDESEEINYIQEVYKKIVQFFNDRYGTKISMNVKSPQRTPIGNYVEGRYWIKPRNENCNLSLKNIVELTDKTEKRVSQIEEPDYFQQAFILAKMPDDY